MMDKEFTVLTECELAKVDGGKGSKGSSYVAGFASAAIAGTGLGCNLWSSMCYDRCTLCAYWLDYSYRCDRRFLR